MGQYYYVVNIDKRQFLSPHKFGCGAKLVEFGLGSRTLSALAILLADGNGRGGGDLLGAEDLPAVGSWAGDRIVIGGDYADKGKFVPDDLKAPVGADQPTLYGLCEERFEEVSALAWEALLRDEWFKEEIKQRLVAGTLFCMLGYLREPTDDEVGGAADDPKLRGVFRKAFGADVINAALTARRF